jgi:NitT/TauT family transport system substrate-binding protein
MPDTDKLEQNIEGGLPMRKLLLGLALIAAGIHPALAQDKLKIAIGQRGNWDTSISEIGQRAGIFKKHGLELELLYTQGGGETNQAVISNSVDIGIASGALGTIGAYSKGAPIRVIGAQMTGAQDLYWYVRAESPIKSLKDVKGNTVAYSTNGASTHGVVKAFQDELKIDLKPVATGSPSSTLTQVMSGQVDVGWAAPPFGLEQLDKKQIRIIASGNDTSFKKQTVRLTITNTAAFTGKKALIDRYMKAYRETLDAMYSDPNMLKIYVDWLQIPLATAERTRNDFFPKEALNPDRIVGLDDILRDAVTFKFTDKPLTKEQVAEMVQIPPRS